MKIVKKLFKIAGILLLVVVVAALGLLGYLTIFEFYPKETVKIDTTKGENTLLEFDGGTFTVLTMNVGYYGLGKESDFFMDGGKMSLAPSKETVLKNYDGIKEILAANSPDFTFLQEVDEQAKRNYFVNGVEKLKADFKQSTAFAYNYKVDYVPYPWPPMGKIYSGLLTMAKYELNDCERIPLPCPFKWPIRVANLKRGLLLSRVPIKGSDKEIVLINFHLEAYDSGEGKIEQTKKLLSVLEEEYKKDNYVIAGGDFNQIFPKSDERYVNTHENLWLPGKLNQEEMGEFVLVWDETAPTCRLLNKPYDPSDKENTQYYIIDGFLVSPNVTASAKTIETHNFEFADHNPVLLTAELN